MEQVLHILVIQLKYGQCDGADTRAHQLLLRVVERQSSLEQWKGLQSIIKEKVYGLIIQAKHEGFQKVDKIVSKLFILREREIKRDELGEERVAEQVEQMCLVFNILYQNGHCLYNLNRDQSVLEGQKASEVA